MAAFSELDQMIRNGRGNSPTFAEALVRHYYDYIYRLAVSILGVPTDADDICQETFIGALLNIDRYSPGTNLKAWLSKIAVHKCQAVLRRRSVSHAWEQTLRNMQKLFHNSPAEMLAQSEKRRELWSMVDSLNEKHRIPVILYFVYDLKIREIAAILDIPEGTVSSRLYNAVHRLGAHLKADDED